MNQNASNTALEKNDLSAAPHQNRLDSLVKPLESFESRVTKFLGSIRLDDNIKQSVAHETIRLILQIQEGTGSNLLRKLAFDNDFFEDFNFFKNQYLDMSAYIHRRLWVAVLDYIQNEKLPESEPLRGDVLFCSGYCDERDIKRLRAKEVREDLNVDAVDLANMRTGNKTKRSLYPYVQSKSYTLNFLSEYDQGLEIADFEQDLLCEMVRVFNSYPRSKGKKLEDNAPAGVEKLESRVQMYLERAVNNKVLHLKTYHTCDLRTRITCTQAEDYKQQKRVNKTIKLLERNLAKAQKAFEDHQARMLLIPEGARPDFALEETKLTAALEKARNDATRIPLLKQQLDEVKQKIRETSSDYVPLVTSLVRKEAGGEEERVIDLADGSQRFLSDESGEDDMVGGTTHITSEDRIWIEDICSRVDEKSAMFIKVIIGDHVADFERWAKDKNIDTDRFDQLVKGARTYYQLSSKDLQENEVIVETLIPYLSSNIRRAHNINERDYRI